MSSIEIREVKTKKDMHKFIKFADMIVIDSIKEPFAIISRNIRTPTCTYNHYITSIIN